MQITDDQIGKIDLNNGKALAILQCLEKQIDTGEEINAHLILSALDYIRTNNEILKKR